MLAKGRRRRGGRRTSQLPISNGDQASRGRSGAVEEGRVLEGAWLLDANVEVIMNVRNLHGESARSYPNIVPS